MTSNVLLSGPYYFLFRKFAAKHKNCETCQSLGVRRGKGVVYCGKELPVAAQDHLIGLGSQNQHLLDAISGKSSVTCRPQLHFVVFETKSTVRPPYMAPE